LLSAIFSAASVGATAERQIQNRIFTGRLSWQPDGIKFTQCVSDQKSVFFAPGGQTMRWIEKWLTPFRIVTTFSLSMSPLGVATIFAQLRRKSLGEIEQRAPAVGAKIGVFCMSRLVCLACA